MGVDDPITAGVDPDKDEKRYVHHLGGLLASAGFPAHFIVDTGRSGKANIRNEWGDWCNVKGAGFGIRPTTATGDDLVDA